MRLSVLDQSPVSEGSTPADALQRTLDLAVLADRLGFHRYWCAEHHASVFQAGAAPEILIGQILSRTCGIRVGSGGVLLPYYSPLKVAEMFRVLHALHPGRVDLGVGKAHLSKAPVVAALRPDTVTDGPGVDRGPGEQSAWEQEEFVSKVRELRNFLRGGFPDDHDFATLHPSPSAPGHPDLWILGSSVSSARTAAELGLPYVYAHFLGPDHTVTAAETYHANYVPAPGSETPSGEPGESGDPGPRFILGVGVYCADTADEAHALFSSHRLFRHRMTRGVTAPVPSPQQAVTELGSDVALAPDPGDADPDEHAAWVRNAVGTPDHVHARITELTTATGAHEVIAVNSIHDHKARLRCYELLAEAFGLTPR